jgi:hypothetical protein
VATYRQRKTRRLRRVLQIVMALSVRSTPHFDAIGQQGPDMHISADWNFRLSFWLSAVVLPHQFA